MATKLDMFLSKFCLLVIEYNMFWANDIIGNGIRGLMKTRIAFDVDILGPDWVNCMFLWITNSHNRDV